MPRTVHHFMSSLIVVCVGLVSVGQPPITPPNLTPEQQQKMKARARLADAYSRITDMSVQAEDFKTARDYGTKALAVWRELHGDLHWKTVNAKLKLADVELRSGMSKERRADLGKAEHLMRDGTQRSDRGDYATAEPLYKEALQIRKGILGEKHPEYLTSLNDLACLYKSQGLLAKAEPLLKEGLQSRKEVLGEKHPDYAQSLNNLAVLYSSQGLYAAAEPMHKVALQIRKEVLGEKSPEYANSLNNLGLLYESQNSFAMAEPLLKDALQICKAVLGVKHPDYALGLNNLAHLYSSQGLYAKAELLYEDALTVRKEILGEKHPNYASSLSNLAALYESQGMYAKAEPLYKKALHLTKEVLGEQHPAYATDLNNLAGLYFAKGLYAKAEPLYQEALKICKLSLGEKHPHYAFSLNNLAHFYNSQGSNAKAESLYQEALQIMKEVFGEKHPNYANSLNNLAAVYYSQKLFSKAEPLFNDALTIQKAVLGGKHPKCAHTLNNLASLYESQGLFTIAEPLFKEALEIRKEILGRRHPDYTVSLNNLASLYYKQRLFLKAAPLYKEAIEIRKEVLGAMHPDYAVSLNNLALLYTSQGLYAREALKLGKELLGEKYLDYVASMDKQSRDLYAKAKLLHFQAIRIVEEHLEETAVIQTESGQLNYTATTRLFLNNLLNLPGADPAEVYAIAFRWRGAVTVRQAFARAARGTEPAVRQTVDELRDVSRKLSHLVTNVSKIGPGVDVPKLMKELSEEREALEKKLVAQSTDFAKYQANRALTPADVQKRLPADAVLVDFLAYGDKIAAFVISQKTIVRVDLMGGKDLADLVENFRNPLNLNLKRPAPKEAAEKEDIRRVVWDPLVPHLKSAKLVLICPDGPLCRLPFAALRGTDPTKYLIEEVAIAVVLVPRLLPDLLADSATQVTGPPSLLLVGDVDFNINSGKPSGNVVRGGRGRWGSLPGTKIETEAIEALFRKQVTGGVVKSLSKGDATQAAIRQGAGNYRYLHIATHGEFLKQTVTLRPDVLGIDDSIVGRARASGVSAGVLCSLVFAGANKPTVDDPGVLSALEIAEMDLSKVELAVLSACETGLGDVASGEGVLGLQRAFQFAGTRTTVTSLWQIPDGATAPLMVRFYENRLKKGMPMLEALREAQLWVLNEGVKSGVLTEPLGEGRRTPPLFWAAFVLAGDWR